MSLGFIICLISFIIAGCNVVYAVSIDWSVRNIFFFIFSTPVLIGCGGNFHPSSVVNISGKPIDNTSYFSQRVDLAQFTKHLNEDLSLRYKMIFSGKKVIDKWEKDMQMKIDCVVAFPGNEELVKEIKHKIERKIK